MKFFSENNFRKAEIIFYYKRRARKLRKQLLRN